MGRKNVVQKQSKYAMDPESEEEPEDDTFLQMQERQHQITDQMLNIYHKLMKYREEHALPMIEYMGIEPFLEFTRETCLTEG